MNSTGDNRDSSLRGSQSFSGSSEDEQAASAGPRSSEGESAWGRALRDIAPYLDLGWRLAGTTAGPPGLGLVVDLWLQTTPWFLLGGCVVGLAGAVLQLKRLQGEGHS
jgi:F0F1-type ATP synthase assembly protein I